MKIVVSSFKIEIIEKSFKIVIIEKLQRQGCDFYSST
jgi:hypothetical protein